MLLQQLKDLQTSVEELKGQVNSVLKCLERQVQTASCSCSTRTRIVALLLPATQEAQRCAVAVHGCAAREVGNAQGRQPLGDGARQASGGLGLSGDVRGGSKNGPKVLCAWPGLPVRQFLFSLMKVEQFVFAGAARLESATTGGPRA